MIYYGRINTDFFIVTNNQTKDKSNLIAYRLPASKYNFCLSGYCKAGIHQADTLEEDQI
jgi:hypothetical protein